MREEFGPGYAVSLAHDHSLGSLGGRTAEQALADGIPPQDVWRAVCEDFDVPPARRFGRDRRRRH
jgi:hypothetical protein